MAFKRTNFTTLVDRKNVSFKQAYSFSKKVGGKFDIGSDAYIIPLGLESGFYETPCHRILPHKAANGEMIGFKGSPFASYIKCKGVDIDGNKVDSLCCQLAKLEKDRIPDKEKSAQRIVSFTGYRMHLPVLILGNSVGDASKKSYPISKVSILNDLRSEAGLKFAYLEMSSSTFGKEIVQAYGNKLKEDGVLDYDLSEESEEFYTEVIGRLPKTVIKVHGVSKTGFSAPMKEYSFFSFDNPAIASGSPEGEREAIVSYKDNQEIQNKICEFLDLFGTEVDNMFPDYTDKELLEYYNSALGIDIHTPLGGQTTQPTAGVKAAAEKEPEEVVEVVEPVKAVSKPTKAPAKQPVKQEVVEKEPISDEELGKILANPYGDDEEEAQSDDSLEEMSFDSDEEDFFAED